MALRNYRLMRSCGLSIRRQVLTLSPLIALITLQHTGVWGLICQELGEKKELYAYVNGPAQLCSFRETNLFLQQALCTANHPTNHTPTPTSTHTQIKLFKLHPLYKTEDYASSCFI